MIPIDDRVVMLVEDNPDDELLTLRALRKNGFKNQVVVARDGAEALEYLIEQEGPESSQKIIRPALVLLDLNLPKIDGLEVLRRLRANERTKSLPVVILTTSSEISDINSSYELGANSFIQKPVEFGEFMEAIKRLGMYLLNEPSTNGVGGEAKIG